MAGSEEKEAVYTRVLGQAGPDAAPECAFPPGGGCDEWYRRAYEARARVARRLDTGFEDPDLEEIWRSWEAMQKAVALKMYDCGRARERWRQAARVPVSLRASTPAPVPRPPRRQT